MLVKYTYETITKVSEIFMFLAALRRAMSQSKRLASKISKD